MNELQIFESEQFGNVRVIEENGKPLFCGSDVAKALGYARPNEAVSKHCKGTSKRRIPTAGGIQEMLFIQEGDVYRLITRSKLPDAERFEKWVFEDVLPSVRKHGLYAVDEVLADPDILINALQALKKEREEKAALQAQNTTQAKLIQEMEPKASYYDKILQTKSVVSTNTIAKDYGMSAVAFNRQLHELKIQYKQGNMWFLYQKYANMGYTQSKTYLVSDTVSKESTYWTQSGRKFLYDKLKENGILPVCEKSNFPLDKPANLC